MVPKDAETFLVGACPIVGRYGVKDWTLRGAAERLERALSANGIEHDIKQYPAAARSGNHSCVRGVSVATAGFGAGFGPRPARQGCHHRRGDGLAPQRHPETRRARLVRGEMCAESCGG
jgi:hypothetical protein